jgi:hypothetical protein
VRKVILLLVLCAPVFAANHYVRQGAAGNGSGSDWTNACTDFSGSCAVASLVRGDTYYVADGAYASRTFDRAASGSQSITIKKATASDHGIETGWLSTYGDGQAAFSATIQFDTPYWVWDGSFRNESNWFDCTAYGFKVNNNADNQMGAYLHSVDNVTVKYTCLDAPSSALPGTTIRRYALDMYDSSYTDAFTGWTASRNLFRFGNVHIFMPQSDGMIVEYNAFDSNSSNAQNHGEAISAYYGSNNAVYRYNKFKDIIGTACIAFISNGVQIYGNLFYRFTGGDGIVGFDGQSHNNNSFHHNTVIDSTPGGIAYGTGSGNTAYNNLFIGNTSANIVGTHNYNGYSGASANGEANAQTGLTTSLFTNYAADDFRLASATTAGTALGSPYTSDLLGNTRGADGTLDRGAYEFVAGGGSQNYSRTPSDSTTAGDSLARQLVSPRTGTDSAASEDSLTGRKVFSSGIRITVPLRN